MSVVFSIPVHLQAGWFYISGDYQRRWARTFWKCFTYFDPVDGSGHHASSGTNSLVMVSCQTHSRCFKVILKKACIIGPRLAASTREVTVYSFVALLAAFSSFLILVFFFGFGIIVNIWFLFQFRLGDSFLLCSKR